jgi:hypothetical protein
MTKLDLHGIRHHEVDRMVENFILKNQNDFPLEIICGNSSRMIKLAMNAINRIGCEVIQNHYGVLIVRRFL